MTRTQGAGETSADVLVVGAGPAGLTTAIVLAREGIGVRVVDKKAGPVEESRALVVHAKTLELLDKLGLAGRAVAEGERLGAIALMAEGTPAGAVSFLDDGAGERTPYPFVLIYEQSRTERLLLAGLEEAGGRVEWGTELLSLAQMPGGTRATVRRPDGAEETIGARWVVGADGAHSFVRESLSLRLEGETYAQTLFLADVDLEWGPRSRQGQREGQREDHQARIDLTPQGFHAFFAMSGGAGRYRLIGSLGPELAGRDALTLDDVRRLITARSRIDVDIARARWISVYRIHHRMAEHFRVGRAFLVGDAAHIHSPAGGQGMNTGIGDAYNLAWKLALVARGAAHPALLDSYEAERVPFARAILAGSDRGFSLQVATNPAAQRLKLLTVPRLFRLLSVTPPLRRRLFWLMSQLWTAYRGSPAVAGSGLAGEGPRAGDRAPYGLFQVGPDAGRGLFEALAGTGHHLLVFEGRAPDSTRLAATREEVEGLLGRYAAPVRVHVIAAGNRALHDRYGARAASLVLVRPDGHIAYRGEAGDLIDLRLYLDRLFVRRETDGAVVGAGTGADGATATAHAPSVPPSTGREPGIEAGDGRAHLWAYARGVGVMLRGRRIRTAA